MQAKEGLLSGLLIILSAGLISVLTTTFIAAIFYRIFEYYLQNFSKKVAKDVDLETQESWDLKDF
jgi:hypothetical protein